MEKYAKELNISDNVKFMGQKANVQTYIVNASVFVSSSDFEGMSNSMLEAMAIGLPVVCTDCPIGGARMVIKIILMAYLHLSEMIEYLRMK